MRSSRKQALLAKAAQETAEQVPAILGHLAALVEKVAQLESKIDQLANPAGENAKAAQETAEQVKEKPAKKPVTKK